MSADQGARRDGGARERTGHSGEQAIDPVASLFSGDRTMPAPVVAPEANESELKRWKSARDSLFGDVVQDKPPAAGAESPRARKAAAALAPPPAGVRTLAVAKVGDGGSEADAAPVHSAGRRPSPPKPIGAPLAAPDDMEDAADEPTQVRTRAAKLAAPPPMQEDDDPPPTLRKARIAAPAPAASTEPTRPRPAAAKKRADTVRTERQRALPAPASPSSEDEVLELAQARRRIRRGPKPMVLAALAVSVLAAGGAAAMFLGVVPSPFEAPSAPQAAPRRGGARPKAASKPSARPAMASLAAAAPAPVKPVVRAASTAAAAKASAAPKAEAAPSPKGAIAKPAPSEALEQTAPRSAEPSSEPEGDGANEGLVLAARKRLAEEDAAGAEALARRALARDPRDHHAMEVLARALIDLDRGQEAVSYARIIVDKRKKRVPYRLLLGDALLMTGDQASARAEWTAAKSLEPNNREVAQRLR